MDAAISYPASRPNTPSPVTHHNTTATPQPRQSTSTTSIPQPHQSTDTSAMPCFDFEKGPNYYGYEAGVNIANLTLKDIKTANKRLEPVRQRRIRDGLIKATRDDPGYVSPKSVANKGFCDYAKWTKTEMLEAMIARGVAQKKARLRDMTKEKMVAKLELADKNSRFPRFLELAPELREMVYVFAMDGKARTRPAPPPISRTSSLVRSESLPVFFKNVTMNIHVFCGPQNEPPHQKGNMVVRSKDRSMQMTKDYFDYFNYAIEKGWVQHMRRFQWYVGSHVNILPGALKRERIQKFQLVFSSKDALQGQLKSEYLKNGRVVVKDHGVVESISKKEKTMTDDKSNFLVLWFLGVYEELKLHKG